MQLSEKVKKLLAEKVGVEPTDIEGESLLRDDLGLDVSLILEEINQTFNCDIPEERMRDAQNVEQLVNLIEEYLEE